MNSKFLLASAVVAAAGVSALRSAPLESYTYEQWLVDYKPETSLRSGFSNGELLKRKSIFNKNVEMIRQHNQQAARGIHTWTMDVNQFADMTEEEFVAKYTGYNQAENIRANPRHFRAGLNGRAAPTNADDLPKSVDWISAGKVTEVKNQGSCGSCWAFAAATTLESHVMIHTDISTHVSTQQLTSCTPNPKKCGGTGGCKGATAQLAFQYVASAAITTEAVYPYNSGSSGQSGSCSYDPSVTKPVVSIGGYTDLPSNDKYALLEAIATKGPISVAVAAGRFMFYRGGIFNGCSAAGDGVINHAVVAVGYNVEDPDNSYLTIRNSWGANWGESGVIRLKLNGGNGSEQCVWDKDPGAGSACEGETDPVLVCGECGVLSDSTFPTRVHSIVNSF